jgi:hypothetical protein
MPEKCCGNCTYYVAKERHCNFTLPNLPYWTCSPEGDEEVYGLLSWNLPATGGEWCETFSQRGGKDA